MTGIAALHLDNGGTNGAVVTTAPGELEQRSSSAMAEYNHHSNGGNGIAYLAAHERAHAGLPHSVSSPSLTVLNSMASGAAPASLAASQQNLRSLLPAYRAAPDYETAVRIKYGDNIAQLLINPTPPVQQPQPPAPHPALQQMVNMYKPPPPYPYSKTSSTSSPNLAAAQGADALTLANCTPPTMTGSMGQLAHHAGQEPLAITMRNGEPIYQNIPLQQPGQQQQQPTRRKWGLPVRSSARSAVISRVQQQTSSSPSSSPSSKRSLADSSISSSTSGTYLVNASVGTATANIKDHLVIHFSSLDHQFKLKLKMYLQRQEVESRLADGQLVLEFELIPRRKAGADFGTAAHPDNLTRNQ